MNRKNKENLRSGELARLACISPDTLRYYERKGLLPSPLRSANGYRLYPAEALHRVRIIRSALAVGFTIHELARIFKIRNHGDAPCEEVLRIAQAKIVDLESRIQRLNLARKDLQNCVREWKTLLDRTEKGKQVRLLEQLSHKNRDDRSSPMLPPGLRKNRRIK